ncbi:MAG: MFS transporter, partial [Candidatus Carbobacillus altaicus]|nr:MFS transporter [Candidatus Carbobacillus altaicus]
YMIGYLKKFTGTNKAGLYFLAGSLLVSFLLVVWSKYLTHQTLTAPSEQNEPL